MEVNETGSRPDAATAQAFATSWNNLPQGSVYTPEQVEDWFAPIQPGDFAGKTVLELGCGNGSLLVHVLGWNPEFVEGVDLGDSVNSARRNAGRTGRAGWKVTQGDLVTFQSKGSDLVYSIGVLHHLKDPHAGFQAVLRNVSPGGRFHCWVYAKEGNLVVRLLVEPLRRIFSRFPWWFTKYLVATPLAVPFYLYGKAVALLGDNALGNAFPLASYMRWIAKREFSFFRHVAFDQLVTPQTCYIDRATVENWLKADHRIGDTYMIFRNGNSWKFGGRLL